MDLRTRTCFTLSRWLMQPPAERTVDYSVYSNWRSDHLAKSWSAFSDNHVTHKDVLDFGCGDGPLSLFLAERKNPRRARMRSNEHRTTFGRRHWRLMSRLSFLSGTRMRYRSPTAPLTPCSHLIAWST